MFIEEVVEFFELIVGVYCYLCILVDVGLGYVWFG